MKTLPLRRVGALLAGRNGRLTRSPRKATLTVLAHSSAASLLSDSGELIGLSQPPHGEVVSERCFLQAIGLAQRPLSLGAGPYLLADVAKAAALPLDLCRSLALYDLLHPVRGRFAYQDLAAARQVAGLLQSGLRLAAIVEAGTMLAERGLRLSQVRLVDAPWGGIAQWIGGQLAQLDGQMTLVLDDEILDAAECFARAEESEQRGDLAGAEVWYAKAERIDRQDPTLPFNRGNVLASAGKPREARLAYRQALARDPSFAEAAFNLAKLHEASGESEEALRLYGEALAMHPAYAAALFNRARLFTEQQRYPEALPLWRTFVEAWPDDPDIGHARRLALLCRMQSPRISE